MQAFPGAYGWGAQATGGRGGEVRVVSNTNFSGAGSFKNAVEADGPAYVVFTTGGVCTMTGAINVQGDLTIAGQTARGGGFTFEGDHPINFHDDNIIMRYLSFRGPRLTIHGAFGTGPFNLMFDHLSLCWGSDDMFSIWYNDVNETQPDIENLSIQSCFFAQGLVGHPTAVMAGGGTGGDSRLGNLVHHISVHNSLFVNVGWRNPYYKCMHSESINNVGWNTSAAFGGCGENGPDFSDESDWIANYWKDGNLANAPSPILHYPNDGASKSSIYVRNNVALGTNGGDITDPTADNWPMVQKSTDYSTEETDQKRSPWTQLSQPTYPVDEVSAVVAFARVPYWAGNIHRLESDGTWTTRRDSFDQGEVDDIDADIGGISSLPSTPGTTPTIAAGTAYTDTDGDGMPDVWELANGLDPNDPSDGPIIGPDGYSNLERFLNGQEGGNGMEAIDNGDGTYTLILTSGTVIGKATITGEINGVPIADIAEVDFTVGAADPATSEISAAPSSIPADGSSQSVIIVQLKDAGGNPLTQGGDTVILNTDLGTFS